MSTAAGGTRRRAPRDLTPATAWEYLLESLARRAYTVAELRRKLVRRGLPEDDVTALLERLVELRLADDDAYAEQYVSARQGSRGRLALRQELRRKGIDAEVAAATLEPLDTAHQLDAASALLLRHAWRYRPADDPDAGEAARRVARLKARARAMAFLARRGFSADVAGAALEASGWFEAP